MEEKVEQKKRNGAIDFWKITMCLIVVIFHSKNITTNDDSFLIGGSIGVEFFFIVSGYLMAKSAEKRYDNQLNTGKDSINFIFGKIKNLFPEILIAYIIGFFVEHLNENFTNKELIKDFISSIWELLFLNDSGLMGFRANAVVWYISSMLISMLILYPLLRKYKNTFLMIMAPLITIFIYGIMYQNLQSLRAPHYWNGFVYKGLLRALAAISLGCICYLLVRFIKNIIIQKFRR